MPNHTPTDFLKELRAFPALPRVFNPWRDVDPLHDVGAQSPAARTDHLLRYLSERVGKARIILCAEALGYQGGHFSGVAMTSERILLGHLAKKNIHPHDVFTGGFQRASRVTSKTPLLGASEPTATILWGALKSAGIDTREVVLWNSFALHPMKHAEGWLTNRKPTLQELRLGQPLLQQLLEMFHDAKTIAIGNVANDILAELGVSVAGHVPHPAYGGATAFRAQIANLLA
jgi:hypothetical protein